MSPLGRLVSIVMAVILPASMTFQVSASPVIVVRANTPQLKTELVQLVARRFQPRELTSVLLADIPKLTADQVITQLCGSVSDDYYAEFQLMNSPVKHDAILGVDGAKYVWPACLHLTAIDTPRNIDPNTADPFQAVVGTTKGDVGGSADTVLGSIFAPLRMSTGFVSVPTQLKLKDGFGVEDTIAALTSLGAVASAPQEEISGHIVGEVDYSVIDPKSAAALACPASAPGFNVDSVYGAYTWSAGHRVTGVHSGSANIYVIDNGFFGADPNRADPFSPAFPKTLFAGWADQPGTVGPITRFGRDTIYPSNYLNGFSESAVPTDVAAHGTHVAGLTLGGPMFVDDRNKLFFHDDGTSQLRMTIINLGVGKRDFLESSENYIHDLLTRAPGDGSQPKSKIVNLSVTYDGPQTTGVFKGLFKEASDTLFVVAAGNDHQDVTPHRIFPAALGGDRANVITVAAHDTSEPASLSWFSNYGAEAVDIAAPGCGLSSWFDDKNIATMSGTSQATPVVVFAAALLNTLDESLTPWQLKARLLASGDLLGQDQVRWNVISGSKLNISEALLLYSDVMEVTIPKSLADQEDHTEVWLGEMVDWWGVECKTDGDDLIGGRPRDMIWSIKYDGRQHYIIGGRDADRMDRCDLKTDGFPTGQGPYVRFKRQAKLIDGKVVPDAADTQKIDIGQVRKLVLEGPHFGHS